MDPQNQEPGTTETIIVRGKKINKAEETHRTAWRDIKIDTRIPHRNADSFGGEITESFSNDAN